MEFFSIGSAYGFAKFAQLNLKWKKREGDISKKTLNTESPDMKQLRESAASTRKSGIISSLDAKLKGGGELTSDELEYLKENSPALYKEAIEIIKERQAYRKALDNCRTKEEVARLNTNKINYALTVGRSISSNPNIPKQTRQGILEKILKRIMGIQGEHLRFVKSPRYTKLPREQELIDAKKDKENAGKDETAEAAEALELIFKNASNELQRLLDGISKEKSEGTEGLDKNVGENEGNAHAKKGDGAPPKSHPAADKNVIIKLASTRAPAVAPAHAAKAYIAKGGVKVAEAPSPKAKLSIKA